MDDDGSQYRLRYCSDSLGSVLNRRDIRAFIVRNKPYDGQELAYKALIGMTDAAEMAVRNVRLASGACCADGIRHRLVTMERR